MFLSLYLSHLQHGLFTCIHKHYTIEEWTAFASKHPEVLGNIATSSGSGDEDYTKLKEIVKRVPAVKYICLDVANGYSEHFVTLVRKARKDFPEHSIMVCSSLVMHCTVYVSPSPLLPPPSLSPAWPACLL